MVGEAPLSQAVASGQKELVVTTSGILSDTLVMRDQMLRCDSGVTITWAFSDRRNGIDVLGNVAIVGCTLRFVATTPSVGPIDADGPHGVALRGANGLRLEGCLLEGWLGDGAYIGPGRDAARSPSSNISIKSCRFVGNGRQGLSIVSGKDVVVEDCVFENTRGSSPESGIDLEPAHWKDQLVNVRVIDCESTNNNGAAYLINVSRLTVASTPISVEFVRTGGSEIASRYPLRVIGFDEDSTPAPGYVKFEDFWWGTPPSD